MKLSHKNHKINKKNILVTAKADRRHINRYKVAHMIAVAEYMRDRASDYGIDGNIAYTVGLLHDIGYLEGRVEHEKAGAEILAAMEVRADIVSAVKNHGDCRLTELPDDMITPMLILMVEADLSVDTLGNKVGFEKRIRDIGKRYGSKNNPRYDETVSNVNFVIQYLKDNYIRSQKEFLETPKENKPRGSEHWIGSVAV